jgi:hypothetical protein
MIVGQSIESNAEMEAISQKNSAHQPTELYFAQFSFVSQIPMSRINPLKVCRLAARTKIETSGRCSEISKPVENYAGISNTFSSQSKPKTKRIKYHRHKRVNSRRFNRIRK